MRSLIQNKGLMRNKRGNVIFIIGFFIVLFFIMFVGFIMIFSSAILIMVVDEFVPAISDVGQIEGTSVNFTQISSFTLDPIDDIIQSFTFLTGVMYMLMLIGAIVVPFSFRSNPNRWLLGFFFLLMIILIIASIFMSNIYQDFYDDTDTLGDTLKEHVLLSFLILQSPLIMTVISFIAGVILFSGIQEEDF